MRRAYAPGLSSLAAVLASTVLVIASCGDNQAAGDGGAAGHGGGGDAGSAGGGGGSAGASGGDSGGAGGSALGGAGGTGGGALGGAGGTGGGALGGAGETGGAPGGAGGTGAGAGSTGDGGAGGSSGAGGGGAAGIGGGAAGIGGGAAGTGGGAGMGSGTCAGDGATLYDVAVNLADLRQKISGFGASTAWGSTMSAADADTLWSTTTGAGLSLHRIRIDYTNGRTSELNIAKLAVARGVTVWASPWTPPVADKSNNNSVGGTLTDGQAFATFLTGFVGYMKGQGVDIFAVSAQNEPDANVTYESCSYTGATMDSFITGFMGPAFANSGVKIMGPETQNWCGFPNFEPTLVKNTFIDIIATHEYGCSPRAYPDIAQAGKEFWQTEIYDSVTTADPGMGSALRVAKLIHDAMTIASMNAWHYWWVYPATNDNGALWDRTSSAPSKRLWVEGNFARFVRPGFRRVGATGAVPAGVLLSAYTNPADGTVAVVAINNNSSATSLSLFIAGAAPCSLTPWVTSSSGSLAARSAVSISGGRAMVMLDPQSVTTLVGRP